MSQQKYLPEWLGSVHNGTPISAYGRGSTLIKLMLGCGQLQIPLIVSVSTLIKLDMISFLFPPGKKGVRRLSKTEKRKRLMLLENVEAYLGVRTNKKYLRHHCKYCSSLVKACALCMVQVAFS